MTMSSFDNWKCTAPEDDARDRKYEDTPDEADELRERKYARLKRLRAYLKSKETT